MPAHQTPHRTSRAGLVPRERTLIAAPILAFSAARLIAGFFPDSPFWGINFAGFLPEGVMIALAAASGLLLVPAVGDVVEAMLESIARILFPDRPRAALATHAIAAIACGVLFWAAFIPFPFLGDGKHVVSGLYRWLHGAGLASGTLWLEPLSVGVYAILVHAASTASSVTEGISLAGYTKVFMAVAAVSGTLTVFALLRLSGWISKEPLKRMALSALMLGASGSLLFFGYVEYYAFLYLFGVLYLFAAVRDARSRRFPVCSGLLLLLAAIFHLSALVFVPSWLFIAMNVRDAVADEQPDIRRRAVFATGGIFALAFAAYVLLPVFGVRTLFIPITAGGGAFRLLAPQHLLDIGNNLLLASPMAIAVLAAAGLTARSGDGRDPGTFAAMIATLSWFSLIIVHSGIARDWDVYALLGASLGMWAFLALSGIRSVRMQRALAAQVVPQAILFLVPWIAVNVTFESAIARFAAITETYVPVLSAGVTAGHFETLRSAFAEAGSEEGEIAIIARSIAMTHNPYEYYKLTRAYETARELTRPMLRTAETTLAGIRELPDSIRFARAGADSAAAALTLDDVSINLLKAVTRLLPQSQRGAWSSQAADLLIGTSRRGFALASFAGNRQFDAKDYDRCISWFQRALADTAARTADPAAITSIHHALGIAYAKRNDAERSLASFRLAVRNPNAPALTWSDYGFACYTFMRFDEAAAAFAHTLRLDSTDVNALYCLGKIDLINPAKHATGRALLERFLAREHGTPRAKDAQEIIALPLEQLRTTKF